MQKKFLLHKLAHDYLGVDESRPEVLCLIGAVLQSCGELHVDACIGNYYSAIEDHANAIKYLRRAVQLDRNYSQAWTLIGHEYIHIKNLQAAIEAYRRALGEHRFGDYSLMKRTDVT